jgi:hypothetical protein
MQPLEGTHLEVPKASACTVMQSQNAEGLAIQVTGKAQLTTRNGQSQLEASKVHNMLPNVKGVNVIWAEVCSLHPFDALHSNVGTARFVHCKMNGLCNPFKVSTA